MYVRAPHRRGTATVQYVTLDGRVRVTMDDSGRTYRARPEHVRPLDGSATAAVSSLTLTRTPSYEAPELAAVSKSPPARSSRYLAWIREQPCAWSGVRGVEASHHPREGHASVSAKCSDYRTLPLAPEVHREWHDRGAIGGMTPEQTRAWVETEINEHLARYVRVLEGEAA